jgi:hypothetical protein
VELPSGYVPPGGVDHHQQWGWPHPYRTDAELLGRGGGPAALVVAHGGGIEPGLVACLPDADHESWGAPLGQCDGARLGFDEDRFVSVVFSRVPAEPLPGSANLGRR